jgi:hypothetical protein
VSFVGLSVGFPRYARGALRFFVYLEAHCAFLIYINLLIKKKKIVQKAKLETLVYGVIII